MIIVYSILAAFIALVAVVMFNTLRCKKDELPDAPALKYDLDEKSIVEKLSEAITYKTITAKDNSDVDSEAFLGFHAFLQKAFPNLHRELKREVINDYSLLYKWKSKQATNKPIVLMAHIDVVPISQKTIDDWKHAPFSGDVDDTYIWGRGTIDMKGHLIAVCEAVEYCMINGIHINRDIYLSFGHDEESIGHNGTKWIIDLFEKRNINPEYVFDEGGAVVNGKMIGASGMLGLIGTCEKGYADITLEASDAGGHSSQPPSETAVTQVAKAIVLLQNDQLKATLNKPVRDFLKYVSPHMGFMYKMLASNLWLFGGVLKFGFERSTLSRALVKTTFAPTMMSGSNASNVLAQKAQVTINFRISPDDSLEKIKRHIKHVLRKTHVKIVDIVAHDPSSVSDVNSSSFKTVVKTAQETMPGIIYSPYLTIATTDSRMFSDISDNVYRFSPFRSLGEDLGTIHANNERIKKESLIEGVAFFIRLIENSNY
jgi:carboxypeptidase PM20D1